MTTRSRLYYNGSYVQSVAPAVLAVDTNGTGVDLQGYEDAAFEFQIGANGITYSGTNKIEFECQESDDNSSFSAIANADLTYTETGSNVGTAKVIDANGKANNVYVTGYKGSKRYIRGVMNFSGTHGTGTAIGCTIIRGRAQRGPVNP